MQKPARTSQTTYLYHFPNYYRKPEENPETDEEQNGDDDESGEPEIQMRNVKTRENKTIDVGDGLVEDYSSKSKVHLLRFYANFIL